MKKRSLLIIAFLLALPAFGQRMYKPKNNKKQYFANKRLEEPLFRWVTGDYSKHGLQLSIGPNYTLVPLKTREESYTITSNELGKDSVMNIERTAKGRPGFFVELGMTHITRRPRKIIHYYDWGIGFKMVGGKELNHTDILNERDSVIAAMEGNGAFHNGYLYGRFAVHSVYQINPHLFLDNALGANVDYAILPGNRGYDGFNYAPNEKFQKDLMAQLHLSIGLGIKPNPAKGFFFIPSIELPLLGAYEWNNGTPQLHWFSSKYYPISLRLKAVLLFKKKPYCPPVEVNGFDKQQINGQ